ncbi:MAG: helix-turn-helix transcriptional regulator [Acidobacteriia bacterium]|nr:helix-turn-helix transcriptional regulator [Terriglobia bacterium]
MAKKDPPDYPGDEAILKAFGEAIRDIRLEKGLSLEEADALFQEAQQQNLYPRLYRALGIVVRQLREKQNMSRAQLSSASGLRVRFISQLERGSVTSATITQIVRLAMGLNYPIDVLVEEVVKKEKELTAE